MTPVCNLLAAGDLEWLTLVGPLVFFIIYLFNYFVGKKQPPAKARPARRAGRPAAPTEMAPKSRSGKSLSAEIEQFLKEAHRKRNQTPRETAAPPTRPVKRVEVPVDVEVLEPPTGETVATSVERHLDNREFTSRATKMSDDMRRADVERAAHFKRQFSHKLGRLTDTSGSEPAEAATPGAVAPAAAVAPGEIASQLANPDNIRRAIVLNEFLQRPQHRW